MKKIVLLGDSIRLIGYGKPVASRLSGEYEVWQPAENCRFAKHTLRGIWDWKDDLDGADIIHWNNGLWDVCDLYGDGPFSSEEEFVENMVRLAKLLKKRARTVIFATITPVRNENPYNKNSVIESFNKALVPKLRELGIVINDLYTPLATDLKRYISDDLIHLSAEGIVLAADLVESVIRREAETTESMDIAALGTENELGGAPV